MPRPAISSQSLQGSPATEVVLTFESVHKILWCDRSNDTFWAVVSHDPNKFVFQHFTKRNLEILLNVDFGHIWECMGQTWTKFVGAQKTLIRNFN